jgi:hypothetical protein
MEISTNMMIVIAIVAGSGLIGLTAVDIFAALEAQAQSFCSTPDFRGGFKNGSNRFLCPPP